MGVTDAFVRFALDASFEDLSENVVTESKRTIPDGIGCALAGIATDKGKIALAMAKRIGGNAESTIIGDGGKVASPAAAFTSGELLNALDYDAASHIQPFVIPPVLSIAESTHASGKDLIVANAIAHEISKRLMLSLSTMMARLTEEHKTPRWVSPAT